MQPAHADAAAPGITRFVLAIGAMKSGTNNLFEYLAGHPTAAPCSEKAPNIFFDRICKADREFRSVSPQADGSPS